MSRKTAPVLDVDQTLRTSRILVCTGSGGVGKTTTAAALALRGAELGRRTVVLTIDPARRLAQSMGLSELDNTPRRVAGVQGDGALDAMMLDMKRTFDQLVVDHAEPGKADAILSNPFYQALSSSFAGTQEYMAMEKLSQLVDTGSYDLVVVDTPPTRSALDFLDAPQRLTTFLDGRMVRILLAPAKAGGKVYLRAVTAGLSVFTNVLTRIIGADVLKDLSQFVAALETMFGGFRERAQATYDLLKADGTAFVVVAAPERDALREAAYFVERLAAERMPLAGLVVNRVHRSAAAGLTAERSLAAAQALEESAPLAPGEVVPLTVAVLRLHADRVALARREARLQERFTRAHPGVPVTEVAAQPGDVHDLAGLRAVGQALGSV
jgi:anion-transporting  ArsA/GET3 family ATPase